MEAARWPRKTGLQGDVSPLYLRKRTCYGASPFPTRMLDDGCQARQQGHMKEKTSQALLHRPKGKHAVPALTCCCGCCIVGVGLSLVYIFEVLLDVVSLLLLALLAWAPHAAEQEHCSR